jgi:hypothetical protein
MRIIEVRPKKAGTLVTSLKNCLVDIVRLGEGRLEPVEK